MTCCAPFASTRPSCATATGTISWSIAATRRRRSGGSCSIFMARARDTWAASDRALRRAPGPEPSAGLRRRLSRARPRLSAARDDLARLRQRASRISPRRRDARRCARCIDRLLDGTDGAHRARRAACRRAVASPGLRRETRGHRQLGRAAGARGCAAAIRWRGRVELAPGDFAPSLPLGSGAGGAWGRCVSAALPSETGRAARGDPRPRRRGRHLVLLGDAAAAGGAARGDVRGLRLLPRGRRHRRQRRAPSGEARCSSPTGAARSTAIFAGAPRPGRCRACSPTSRRYALARGFPRHHRRHGDGRRRRHPRARPRRARSLLRPRRERRGPALRAHLRRATCRPPTASPMRSAARCSSPTSCAISTRTARAAGSICRANCWSSKAFRRPSPAPCSPIRRSPAVCARLADIAEQHFAEAAAAMRAMPAPRHAPGGGDGRGLSRHPRPVAPARLARPRARGRLPAALKLWFALRHGLM